MLGVTPHQEIREGIFVELGLQHPCPPRRVRQVLQPALSQGKEFLMLLGKAGDKLHISIELAHKVLLRAPLIGIESDEVNTTVAGIILH